MAIQLLGFLSVLLARRFDWLPRARRIPISSAVRVTYLGLYVGTWMGVVYYYGQGESALNAVLNGLVTGLVFSVVFEWSYRRRRERNNLH
jgi:hypothetical protein